MPTFLYTAKTRAGLPVAERITANNTSAARYALETRGYTNIQFETDDMQASIDRAIGAKPPPDGWTPELEMESRRLGGPWSHLAFALKVHAVFWVPLVCWNIYPELRSWERSPRRGAGSARRWRAVFGGSPKSSCHSLFCAGRKVTRNCL